MPDDNISALFVINNALLASRLAKKAGNRLSVHGISLTEYIAMHYLSSNLIKEISRIELAEYLGMSASGVTRLLLPMEKTGIIEKVRNPRDSRQSLVKLSVTGRRLLEEASVSFSHISTDLTSNLSPTQQERMVELFGKLL